jgi:hypothetical protein
MLIFILLPISREALRFENHFVSNEYCYEHTCNTREGQGPDRSVVPSRKVKYVRGGRKEGSGRGAGRGGAEEDSA